MEWHRTKPALLPYLVVSPQPGQPIGIHYPKELGFLVFPSDEVLVPAVRKQLINIVPEQPAVCGERSKTVVTSALAFILDTSGQRCSESTVGSRAETAAVI